MKVAPRLLPAMLASLATLSAGGCRTASPGSIAHTRPPEVRPQATFDLQEFVAEHNENSQRIQSLEAKPAITVTMGPQGDSRSGGVNGLLALERPRNFKLELAHSWSTIGDIGSNDDRFWFWFKNDKDKSVYCCDYSELSSTSLAVSYQPDWIVEAMGLKEITPDEAAQIKMRPGTQPGTTVLTFAPTKAGGQTYSRVMVVSDSTRKVSEFRVISGDGKATIAQATIKKYRSLPVGGRTASENSTARETCSLPENIVLEWKRELLTLDVVLEDVRVNQFDTSKRTARFVQPTPYGCAPVNLAEVARQKEPAASSTAVRQTMPVPESPNRARLSPPLQIRGEDASAANTPRRQDQARPKSPILAVDLEVVGAPAPIAPGTPSEGSTTALLTGPGNSLER